MDEFDALSGLRQLIRAGEKRVEALEDEDQELHLRQLRSARELLSTPALTERTWGAYKQGLTAEIFLGLEFTSRALSRAGVETAIDEQELAPLLKEVRELLDDVQNAHIGQELKEFLVDSLVEIQDGILAYRIRGAEGLRRVLQSSLGGAVLQQHDLAQSENEPQVRGFVNILRKLSGIVDTAYRAKQLIEPVLKSLLPGSSS